MRLPPREAVLLRVFLGEDDRADGRPLYEALVLKAREMGMAGATVLRGPMGFGHDSVAYGEDPAIVYRPADDRRNRRLAGKNRRLLDAIEPMIGSGLVTLEKATVIRYGEGELPGR
jgi:uncharacterized protein